MIGTAPRVLLVTDTFLSVKEPSLWTALKKQAAVLAASRRGALDTRLKLIAAEALFAQRRVARSRRFARAPWRPTVEQLLEKDYSLGAPELTEVALMTCLAAEGVAFEAITYAEAYADRARLEASLDRCDAVFASTTLLRSEVEMAVLLPIFKRPGNRVVAGGALAGALHRDWKGCPGVDVLAVGYGELLVPPLAAWIRSGFTCLQPPHGGSIEQRGDALVLFSGTPHGRNLDWLPRPDWRLAERVHGRCFPMVHYESVRGCPYRCSFCNYPFLFDDTKFRYKSAERIVGDWSWYASLGVKWISCLDSLFTMPRRRLIALCEKLIERRLGLRWICYARADDLTEPSVCALMKAAGCHQVQIGAESGSQQILENMNKRSTVSLNRAAIRNCRDAGITTLVSVILGFPGETQDTMQATYDFLRDTRPDFYYAAPFSVDVEQVPVLSESSRERFALWCAEPGAPTRYWRHATMDCATVARSWRRFNTSMMRERVSLEASLHYQVIPHYDRAVHREPLLDFQLEASRNFPVMRAAFEALHKAADWRLRRDLRPT